MCSEDESVETGKRSACSTVKSGVRPTVPIDDGDLIEMSYKKDRINHRPLVYIDTEGGDDSIVSEDCYYPLMEWNKGAARTCAGGDETIKRPSFYLLHIQQRDKWSCGFRNLQMLLVTLVPSLPPEHIYFDNGSWNGQAFRVPSLQQLQASLERSWRAGYDPDGAQHYQNRILGKNSKIGAVEVSTTLSFMSIDSVVVQFITCPESRGKLGPFCSTYFGKEADCCPFCRTVAIPSCLTIAKQVVNSTCRIVPSARRSKRCGCPVIPLYLQWEGHSVTIIGVEESKIGLPLNLLVLDPLQRSATTRGAILRQRLTPLRLALQPLSRKDCQVVLASPRDLSPLDSEQRKHALAFTVEQQAVRRALEIRTR